MLVTDTLADGVAVEERLELREMEGDGEELGDPDVVTEDVLVFDDRTERELDTDTVVVFDARADRDDVADTVIDVEFRADALDLTDTDDEFEPVMDRVHVEATVPVRVTLLLTEELDVGELVREMVGDALCEPESDIEPDEDIVELAETGAAVPVFVPLALPERLALPESDTDCRTDPVGVVESVMLIVGRVEPDELELPVGETVVSGERVDVDEMLSLKETRGLTLGDDEKLGLRETTTLRETDAVDVPVFEFVVVPLIDPDIERVLLTVTVPVFVLVDVRDVVVVDVFDANALRESSGLRDSRGLRDSVDDTLGDRLTRGEADGDWLVDGDLKDRLADALLIGEAESP